MSNDSKPSLFIKGGVGGPGRPKNAVKQIQVESHTMATNVNPIAEAMMQIKEKAEGFSYQNRNLSGTKDPKEPSTTN